MVKSQNERSIKQESWKKLEIAQEKLQNNLVKAVKDRKEAIKELENEKKRALNKELENIKMI